MNGTTTDDRSRRTTGASRATATTDAGKQTGDVSRDAVGAVEEGVGKAGATITTSMDGRRLETGAALVVVEDCLCPIGYHGRTFAASSRMHALDELRWEAPFGSHLYDVLMLRFSRAIRNFNDAVSGKEVAL